MRIVELEEGEHVVSIELSDYKGDPIGSVLIALDPGELNRLENRNPAGTLMPGYAAASIVGPFTVRVGLIS